MYCPQCGHENPEEGRFCVQCGVRLEGTVVAPRPSVVTGRQVILPIIGVGAVVLAVLAVSLSSVFRQDQESRVVSVIKRGVKLMNDADWERYYNELMTPNYRRNASYEEFKSYMELGYGLGQLMGPGGWNVRDIQVQVEGDCAYATYRLFKGDRFVVTQRDDPYRLIKGRWYEVITERSIPGYNEADQCPPRRARRK